MDELHATSLGALADADVARLVDAVTAAASRVTSLRCLSTSEADRRRLADEVGARQTAAWLAVRSQSTRADAARLTGLATALAHERWHGRSLRERYGPARLPQCGFRTNRKRCGCTESCMSSETETSPAPCRSRSQRGASLRLVAETGPQVGWC